MTTRLGDLLRETLRRSGQHEVALRDELHLLAHYLDIEKMRFGKRLVASLDVDAASECCQVPSLLLQPLVENAIRHGLSPKAEGGAVTIRARALSRCLCLQVTDTGVGLPVGAAFTDGVGLGVTRARLTQLYGADHRFSIRTASGGIGVIVTVIIPRRSPSSSQPTAIRST